MFSVAVYFLLSYYVAMPFYVLIFVLLATAFVDIDIKNSKAGNHWYFRFLQFFTNHLLIAPKTRKITVHSRSNMSNANRLSPNSHPRSILTGTKPRYTLPRIPLVIIG